MEGFALRLALKQRWNATRKSTIKNLKTTETVKYKQRSSCTKVPIYGFQLSVIIYCLKLNCSVKLLNFANFKYI